MNATPLVVTLVIFLAATIVFLISRNSGDDVKDVKKEKVQDEKKANSAQNAQARWNAFVEGLPAKIAGLPHVSAIAVAAGPDVTVEVVEKQLGIRPSHWVKFSEFVLADEQPPSFKSASSWKSDPGCQTRPRTDRLVHYLCAMVIRLGPRAGNHAEELDSA